MSENDELIRKCGNESVDQSRRRKLARETLRKAFAEGLVEVGERTWGREDLYRVAAAADPARQKRG